MKALPVLPTLLLLAALGGCQYGGETTIPAELHGVWKASQQKYADRFFELTPNTVSVGIGKGNKETYAVRRIKKAREGDKTLYAIHYTDSEGLESKIFLAYEPQGGGLIRFRNQKETAWKRARAE